MPKPSPQERNSLASLYPSPWGGENFLSALCAFFWQSMFCSLYGTLPKLCATFWGFPVTNSSVLSLLKGKNISVPSAAVLLLDLRGHPPITYSEKRQICAPYYNLDTIPPSILSFSLFSCTLYKARKKGSNHLQIKSISSASRQIRPYPHKEMFAHPPLVRTSE